ncbi:MAG: type II toxin-antitoxin system mRNA interferase toxin [Candidatus Paraimprobicoccus trichonymphae]|uniref:Type II toxin-antitoxin system mRNA interferase toxin n=1 Tax=Candidatus Paraimprobicoccus trichonymphae TaxID=3033793 RepID=A0AA48KZ64_9FIRM|nr:MAG: type II toxin-antitoxin system mRNA interferase toxin [Candidatus Paraimprobicoccus trichonymphae]
MKCQCTFTNRFKKSFKTLNQNEKKQFVKKLELLSNNPMHPSLRTKRIRGTDNLFECSVNMDIRFIWYYKDESLIIIADIGHHNILNQF